MHVLVFQHLPIEHPGVLREFWRGAGYEWATIELKASLGANGAEGLEADVARAIGDLSAAARRFDEAFTCAICGTAPAP